jgi:hypothetical protein
LSITGQRNFCWVICLYYKTEELLLSYLFVLQDRGTFIDLFVCITGQRNFCWVICLYSAVVADLVFSTQNRGSGFKVGERRWFTWGGQRRTTVNVHATYLVRKSRYFHPTRRTPTPKTRGFIHNTLFMHALN